MPFTTNWAIISLAPHLQQEDKILSALSEREDSHLVGRPEYRSLNKRSEIISKCRRNEKILLKNYKTPPLVLDLNTPHLCVCFRQLFVDLLVQRGVFLNNPFFKQPFFNQPFFYVFMLIA